MSDKSRIEILCEQAKVRRLKHLGLYQGNPLPEEEKPVIRCHYATHLTRDLFTCGYAHNYCQTKLPFGYGNFCRHEMGR